MIPRRSHKQDLSRQFKINERIFAPQVRVLDNEGKQIGIMPTREALEKARELELDLVEITAAANPPVVKMIDFNKFIYQLEKKKAEEKKKAKSSEMKEVRLGPFMGDNDLDTMVKRARTFLEAGDKVKFVVRFSGRQITHPEFGYKILEKAFEKIADIAKIEREPKLEGKQLITFVMPERKK